MVESLKKSVERLIHFYKPIVGYILFWLLYFQLLRLCFFLYHNSKAEALDLLETFRVFWYGIHVDLSLTSYILIFPLLVFIIQLFFKKQFYKGLIKYYSIGMLTLTALIALVDMELYDSWGFKINNEVLFYLKYPEEAMASVGASPIILLGLGYLLFTFGSIFMLRKITFKRFQVPIHFSSFKAFKYNFLLVLSLAPLLGIGMRGGLHIAPFNPSYVYFSNQPVLNHSSLNASWNLMYSLMSKPDSYALDYMTIEEETRRMDFLFENKGGETSSVLNQVKPNVVLVILEGWTADVISSLEGLEGVTPNFDELTKEGLLFTNFYASGDRTYKGVPAILSGFPALPSGSVIKYTSKMEKLPSICQSLNDEGYVSSFHYGGELSFANIKAYIQHCGYGNIVNKFHFEREQWTGSKWGVHDHDLFNRVIVDLKEAKSPFFSTLLTQSSHEPFDVPMETKFDGEDRNEQFKNSVYYTDKSLGEFMEKARAQDWYENTLFVFLADHGKNLPLGRASWDPLMFRIPLLFYGEVLKEQLKGKTNEKYGAQTDLAYTLLNQLGVERKDFNWGKDLLSPTSEAFAFYDYNGGFGWVTKGKKVAYDYRSDQLFYEHGEGSAELTKESEQNAKAYMQALSRSFEEL